MNVFNGLLILFFVFGLVGCGDEGDNSEYTVTANVSGLADGESVRLELYEENFDEIHSFKIATSNALQAFPVKVDDGEDIFVTVATQPTSQACTVNDFFINSINQDETVEVVCSSTIRHISVAVTGLGTDKSFSLAFNRDYVTEITADGTYDIDAEFANGTSYAATFASLPQGQYCEMTNGSGTFSADVELSIVCNTAHQLFTAYNEVFYGDFGGRAAADQTCEDYITENSFTLDCPGGLVAFMSTSESDEIRDFPTAYGLTTTIPIYTEFLDHVPDDLRDQTISKIADDWADLLEGALDDQPKLSGTWSGSDTSGALSDNCENWTSASASSVGDALTGGSESDWLSEQAACSMRNYISCLCIVEVEESNTVSGTLSGLVSGTVTLSLNSGEQTLSLTENGDFTFDESVNTGDSYSVAVASAPSFVTCTVGNGSGTISGDVSNITVSCAATANFVFPTDDSYATSSFATRSTADALCSATQSATYSTLPCDTVHAFISYSSSDEIADFPTLYGVDTTLPLLDASDSNAELAAEWSDLLGSSPTIEDAVGFDWWSGTNADGSVSLFNCSAWTLTDGTDATVGRLGETGEFWKGTSDGMCNESHRLMCLCYQ